MNLEVVARFFWGEGRQHTIDVAIDALNHPIVVESDGVRTTMTFHDRRGTIADVATERELALAFGQALTSSVIGVDIGDAEIGTAKASIAFGHAAHNALVHAQAQLARAREWLRLSQPWLSQPFGLPAQVAPAELFLSGSPISGVEAPKLVLGPDRYIVRGGPIVDAAKLAHIEWALREGHTPPPGRELLADAQYFGLWARPRDPSRAVLVAAIACEVAAKAMLQELAHYEALPLLEEVVVTNQRAFPQAAIDLFRGVAGAVTGRSLHDEDRKLSKAVQTLFELRNRVAHKGHRPSETEAAEAVTAAKHAFEWLAQVIEDHYCGLHPTPSPSEPTTWPVDED